MKIKKIILLCIVLSIVLLSKPVKVDEILTEKGTFKLDISVAYSNIQQSKEMMSSMLYQTQNGDFIYLPTYLGSRDNNQDYFNYIFTLRYGINKDLELFVSLNLYNSTSYFQLSNVFENESMNGFNSLKMGATYQIKKETDTPSLLLGISADVLENTVLGKEIEESYFKNFRIFGTSYYTVDPVVFLLQASYDISLQHEFTKMNVENGDIFTFSPQVYFSVNPYTNIYGGVRYTYQNENKVNEKIITINGSNISFLTGATYELNTKMILDVNAEFLNSIQTSRNTIATTLSYKF